MCTSIKIITIIPTWQITFKAIHHDVKVRIKSCRGATCFLAFYVDPYFPFKICLLLTVYCSIPYCYDYLQTKTVLESSEQFAMCMPRPPLLGTQELTPYTYVLSPCTYPIHAGSMEQSVVAGLINVLAAPVLLLQAHAYNENINKRLARIWLYIQYQPIPVWLISNTKITYVLFLWFRVGQEAIM